MLLRAVAKIVVVNEASNFELEGVSAVANVPRQGSCITLSLLLLWAMLVI